MSEWSAKLGRVRDFLDEQGYGTLVLHRLDNVFWLGCGADTHVPLGSELSNVWMVVTRERVTVVADAIEAPRVADEEFADLDVEVREIPWHDGDPEAVIAELADPDGRVAGDTPAAGRELVNLQPLRWSLLPEEVERYRALGADMGAAVGEVARGFDREDTEFVIAARIARALFARGITPTVLLVAADERIRRYRHPIPTARGIEEMVMLVAGGRRDGLIVSLTRLVHFGEPSEELQRRHDAVCQVDAALIANTMPGAKASAVFAAGVDAYRQTGFADEWKRHHQGGATGYQGRDYKATLDTAAVVQPWQAFTWNPSIAGTKSEDTLLATPDGPEIVSASPDWPLFEKQAAGQRVARPAILVR